MQFGGHFGARWLGLLATLFMLPVVMAASQCAGYEIITQAADLGELTDALAFASVCIEITGVVVADAPGQSTTYFRRRLQLPGDDDFDDGCAHGNRGNYDVSTDVGTLVGSRARQLDDSGPCAAAMACITDGQDVRLWSNSTNSSLGILDGSGTHRILSVDAGARLSLQGLRLKGGNAGGTYGSGAGVEYSGGAIKSFGNVMVDDCEFADNHATYSYGGSIYSQDGADRNATLTITASVFDNGDAKAGGVLAMEGGHLQVSGSTFRNAASGVDGGGAINLWNSGDPGAGSTPFAAWISTSDFEGNVASLGAGGAILVHDQTGASNATIEFCTFRGNAAEYGGGAIRTNAPGTVLRGNVFGGVPVTNDDEDGIIFARFVDTVQPGSIASLTACGDGTFDRCEAMVPPDAYSYTPVYNCTPPSRGSCGTCPAGTFVPILPSSVDTTPDCEQCPAGSTSLAGAAGCTVCGPGRYAELGFDTCKPCPAGHFIPPDLAASEHISESSCQACTPGRYADDELDGASECLPCLPGQQQRASGQSGCDSCDPGYVSEEGDAVCTPCESGTRAHDNVCEDCEAGRYAASGAQSACELCDAGKYAAENAAAVCNKCDDARGYTSDPGEAACEKCITGFAASRDAKCAPCPDGTRCTSAGFRLDNIEVDAGFWRQFDDSLAIRQCRLPGCAGGNAAGHYCNDGHEGPLCAVCSWPGFVRNAEGTCDTCAAGASVLYAVALPLVCAAAAVAVVRLLYGLFVYACGVKAVFNRDLYGSAMTKLKVVTTTAQIMGGFVATFEVTWPPAFAAFAQRVLGIFSLDVLAVVPVGCIVRQDYHSRLVFTTLLPLGLALVIAAAHLRSPRKAVPYLLVLSYLVFPSVSTTIFQAWGCDGDFDEGVFLKVDYSIDCESPSHRAYQVYAWAMLAVYPIGVPVMYGHLLYSVRGRLRPWIDLVEGVEEAAGVKAGATVRRSIAADLRMLSKVKPERAAAAVAATNQEAQVRQREADPGIQSISFLWSMYKPKFWWFELVMCAHRLLLSGVIVVFRPGSASQIVAAIFICLFFALVFNATKACLKENDNFFNFYAEIDLLFVLIVSLLLYTDVADEEGYGTGLVGGLLIFAAVFVVVMGLGLLLLEAEEEFMFSHTLAAKWRGGMRKEKAATGAEEEVELELGGMIFETENPMGGSSSSRRGARDDSRGGGRAWSSRAAGAPQVAGGRSPW